MCLLKALPVLYPPSVCRHAGPVLGKRFPMQVSWVMPTCCQQPSPDRIDKMEVKEPRTAWQLKLCQVNAVAVPNRIPKPVDMSTYGLH